MNEANITIFDITVETYFPVANVKIYSLPYLFFHLSSEMRIYLCLAQCSNEEGFLGYFALRGVGQ